MSYNHFYTRSKGREPYTAFSTLPVAKPSGLATMRSALNRSAALRMNETSTFHFTLGGVQ
jgi:hypothetical protein